MVVEPGGKPWAISEKYTTYLVQNFKYPVFIHCYLDASTLCFSDSCIHIYEGT